MKKVILIISLIIAGIIIYSCTKEHSKSNNNVNENNQSKLKSLNEDFNMEVGEIYDFYAQINENEVNKTSIVKDYDGSVFVSGRIYQLNEIDKNLLCKKGSLFYIEFPVYNIKVVTESELYIDFNNIDNAWLITLGDSAINKGKPVNNCASKIVKGGLTVNCCCETNNQPNTYGKCRVASNYGPNTAPNTYCDDASEGRKCTDCGGSCKKSVTSMKVIDYAGIIIKANNVKLVDTLPVIKK